MLEYCRLRQISVKDLASNLQASPTNFAKSCIDRDLGSQYVVIFLQVYDEVSPDWLLLDRGNMLRPDSELRSENQTDELIMQNCEVTSKDRIWKELVNSKNQIIELQAQRIKELQEYVAELKAIQK